MWSDTGLRPYCLTLLTSVLLLIWASPLRLAAQEVYSAGKISFAVEVQGEHVPYRTFGVYVLPGGKVSLEFLAEGGLRGLEIAVPQASLTGSGARRRTWRAPKEPGIYPIEIRSLESGETMLLNVFVMIPFRPGEDETLEGYRIGKYPKTALRGLKVYERPLGLVRVTRKNLGTPVSPHFTLEQFLCKQEGDFPKFLILRERLLLKLEYLLQVVNEKGFRAKTFHVMSGYRTPFYNHAIGNVKYSRHQWGDAADIFIDEGPKDGVMDDLNGDGEIDLQDADLLYSLFEGLIKRASYEPLIGGMGSYGTTPNHGPFVHVDTRGFRARW